MLTPEIKDMKTWEEAELWLSRHGWGSALIEEQKIIWDEQNAPPVIAPVKPIETAKPIVKEIKSVKKGK